MVGLEADAVGKDVKYYDSKGVESHINATDTLITVNGSFNIDKVFMAGDDWTSIGTYRNDYGTTTHDVYVSKQDPTMYVKVQQLTI